METQKHVLTAQVALLNKLERLYYLTKDGITIPSHQIIKEAGIEERYWRQLIDHGLISRTGSLNKSTYSWVAVKPNEIIVNRLMSDYPIFNHRELGIGDIHEKLHPKDELFNWVIPSGGSGRNIKQDFRINHKYGHTYINRNFIIENYPDLLDKDLKVAFVLSKDKCLIVFNPPQGVPFYTYKPDKNKKANTFTNPRLSNKNLSELLKRNMGTGKELLDCRIEFYDEINNIDFYKIIVDL